MAKGKSPSGSSPSPAPAPPPRPAGGPPPLTPSAFDRPFAVLVVGPKPIDVRIVDGGEGGSGGGGEKKEPADRKPKEGWTRWAARNVGAASRGAGVAAAAAAGNQGMAGFQAGIAGASNALSALGPKGMAAAAALQSVGMAATAVQRTVDAFVARGRELSGLSGPLAGATAVADVRKFQADMREADRLGPQMARLIENQQKSDEVMRAILMPVKEWILDRLNAMMEGMLKGSAELIDGINEMIDWLNGPANGKLDVLTRMAKEIRDILKGAGPNAGVDRWLDDLRDFAGQFQRPMGPIGAPIPGPP